jgi:ubiquinone/menaquinone biosynthesis C-methylase UbiE
MFKTQRQHEAYWEQREIDWQGCYLDTWNHPHRQMIIDALKTFRFQSLLELGCASGPNLLRIQKEFPGVRLSGIDLNAKAIETARTHLASGADLRVGSVDEIDLPDKSIDIVVTDMVLIYVSGIGRALAEIRRVARVGAIFCEFHSHSVLARLALKLLTGYRAHDYERLLTEHGWCEVKISKIPVHLWPRGRTQKHFGYVIAARA